MTNSNHKKIAIKFLLFASLIFILTILSGCSKEIIYDSNYNLDPAYVLKAAGINQTEYANLLFVDSKQASLGGAGDTMLVLARLKNDSKYYEFACNYYANYITQSNEELAIMLESRASLNCEGKRIELLEQAAQIWNDQGVLWRSKLLKNILTNETNLQFETSKLEPIIEKISSEEISIGETKTTINENSNVVTQVDRVYRDWLGVQLRQSPFRGEILTTFSERLTYNESELRSDIGWHEGGRMLDLKTNVGIEPIAAVGTIIAKFQNKWYAPDDNGIFKFEVPLDKVSYPTTRFLTEDIAMIVDTHGVNMLVEQAIRKQATHVLSDCDHEDKTKAAVYLSQKNVDIICFPDRFAYRALGHNINLVSSPTWTIENNSITYGGNPLTLQRNQKIIVTNATLGKTYAVWYYTTPTLYFDEIKKIFPLDITTVAVDDYNQLGLVFEKAREENVNVVATRIFRMSDYREAKEWLEENNQKKIIVFHTTMYPAGILLMQEFPNQVHNADANIVPQ